MVRISVSKIIEEKGRAILNAIINLHSISDSSTRHTILTLEGLEMTRTFSIGAHGEGNSITKVYRKLRSGDVVRVVCRKGTEFSEVVDTTNCSHNNFVENESHIFMILAMYQTDASSIWAAVSKLKCEEDENLYSFTLSSQSVQILQMTSMVQKCGAIHNCHKDKRCSLVQEKNRITHHFDSFSSTHVFVLTSRSGFPFRTA